MCGPWAIPLALTIGGTVASYVGDREAQHAQNTTYEAERQRQQHFDQANQTAFADSLAKAKAAAGADTQAKATEKRETALDAALVQGGQGPTSYLPGSSSAPKVVQTAEDSASEAGQARSLGLAHALASLGGMDDTMQQLGFDLGHNAQTIDTNAHMAADSRSVLDSELKAAAQKGSTLRGLGSLAQTIGAAWLGTKLPTTGLFGHGMPINLLENTPYA